MVIDWNLVVAIGVPVATLFLGAWVNRRFERRPNLTSYYGHVGVFRHTLDDGTKAPVYTHSVVLRNSGRRSATNVRIRHAVLPSFNVAPPIEHAVLDLADGAKEIVLPTLVPGEEITISYLYFPPLTVAGINVGIRSDEGFARQIPMLLQRQYPAWFNVSAALLMFVGLVALIYVIVRGVRMLMS